MKKLTLIPIFALLIAGTAYAQTASSSNINGENQQVGKAKQQIELAKQNAKNAIKNAREFASSTRASAGGDIKGKRAEIKLAVQELTQQKIENRINQVKMSALKDFDITVKNLDNLKLRIDSRITKLEASGTVDMTEQRNLLEIASTSIEVVRVAVNNFRTTDYFASTTLEESSASTTEKILVQEIKDKILEIKVLIKDAHSALVNVVNSLIPGQVQNATTTE